MGNALKTLFTTIGPSPLLTLAVLPHSLAEVTAFEPQTAVRGVDRKCFRISPLTSEHRQVHGGDVRIHADRTGVYGSFVLAEALRRKQPAARLKSRR